MIVHDVLAKMETGRLGLNKGLPMGFDRLVKYIPGIQQGTYYLIGGETGSGKTAFTDDAFLHNPYDWYKANPNNGVKLKIFYWSLEIDKTIKMTKAICRKLHLDYPSLPLVDVNYVLSRGKSRVSQEIYEAVHSTADYFQEMEDVLTIMDAGSNPTGINKFMLNYAKNNGDTLYKNVKDGEDSYSIFDKYVPYRPNEYVIMIIDHIGLMKREKGNNKKDNIDKMSEYLIALRNNYNYIPVVVQQLNRSNSQTDRFKLDMVEPKLSDFKDSGSTQEDSNVVMSLFSPRRHELNAFRGYDITKLKDRFRSLSVLKNRDGEADVRVGLQFIGEVGKFNEIPKAEDFKNDPSLYDKVINLQKI